MRVGYGHRGFVQAVVEGIDVGYYLGVEKFVADRRYKHSPEETVFTQSRFGKLTFTEIAPLCERYVAVVISDIRFRPVG